MSDIPASRIWLFCPESTKVIPASTTLVARPASSGTPGTVHPLSKMGASICGSPFSRGSSPGKSSLLRGKGQPANSKKLMLNHAPTDANLAKLKCLQRLIDSTDFKRSRSSKRVPMHTAQLSGGRGPKFSVLKQRLTRTRPLPANLNSVSRKAAFC